MRHLLTYHALKLPEADREEKARLLDLAGRTVSPSRSTRGAGHEYLLISNQWDQFLADMVRSYLYRSTGQVCRHELWRGGESDEPEGPQTRISVFFGGPRATLTGRFCVERFGACPGIELLFGKRERGHGVWVRNHPTRIEVLAAGNGLHNTVQAVALLLQNMTEIQKGWAGRGSDLWSIFEKLETRAIQ